MEIKKVVVKLDIHDNKDKQRVMKAVSSLAGINSLEVDLKDSKMTVIGEVDPVAVIGKLRKQWNAQIVTVGPPPSKEVKKDGGDKKDGDKKDGDKKDGDKKDGDKKDDGKKGGDNKDAPPVFWPPPYSYSYSYPHLQHHPPINPMHYHVQSIEENPNACVIC